MAGVSKPTRPPDLFALPPVVRLIHERTDAALAVRLDEERLRRYQAVPLEADRGGLRFALADPGRHEELAWETGLTFRAFMAAAAGIEATLDSLFASRPVPAADGAVYRTMRALGMLTTEQEATAAAAERKRVP